MTETPYILIDQERLTANIKAMQAIADKAGVRMRPHAKTHKSVAIAEQQMAAGAVGLTVAKPAEALVFIEAGIPSVKICFPIIQPGPMRQVLAAAREYDAEVICVIDSEPGLEALAALATEINTTIPVYIEIDAGLERCGVRAESDALLNLGKAIDATANLQFLGLTSHAGHAYVKTSMADAAAVAEQERLTMLQAKERLEAAGIPTPEIAVGATPSLWAQQDFTGITEIKPGNYVFNDLTQLGIGVVEWERLALTIRAQVVSVNDTYMIIDAGSKMLSSDLGPHGNQSITGHGRAFIDGETPGQDAGREVTKLSEEHGWIAHHGAPLPIGTLLTIYPNHSCPVINLKDTKLVQRNCGSLEEWPIDARGRT